MTIAVAEYGPGRRRPPGQPQVSIAPRWVECHLDMVLATADAGAPIHLEKPMARTPREEMIAACEKARKIAVKPMAPIGSSAARTSGAWRQVRCATASCRGGRFGPPLVRRPSVWPGGGEWRRLWYRTGEG